jgi:hypothetical protein
LPIGVVGFDDAAAASNDAGMGVQGFDDDAASGDAGIGVAGDLVFIFTSVVKYTDALAVKIDFSIPS